MIASISAAIVNIITNYMFIPIFGYMAAAYTTLVSHIILAAIQAFSARRVHKIFAHQREVYYEWYVLLLGVAIVLTTLSGLFFYKTDLRFGKILLCRLVVNVFLNGIFGSILWGIYSNLNFDGTISYMLTISMPKNIIFLIPQSILLYLTFRLVVPLFERNDIVSKEVIDSSFKNKNIAQK